MIAGAIRSAKERGRGGPCATSKLFFKQERHTGDKGDDIPTFRQAPAVHRVSRTIAVFTRISA